MCSTKINTYIGATDLFQLVVREHFLPKHIVSMVMWFARRLFETVVVFGKYGTYYYDWTTNTWTRRGADHDVDFIRTAAARTRDGKALIYNGVGYDNAIGLDTYIYDMAAHKFACVCENPIVKARKRAKLQGTVYSLPRNTPSLLRGRNKHALALLLDGRILCLGGYHNNNTSAVDIEMFEPDVNQWRILDVVLPHPMNDPSMTVLADGNVFVCGGRMYNGDVLKTAYILDTKTMHWRAAAKMQRGRMEHVCVTMPDGSVMIIGGRTTNTGTNNMFVPFIYMNAVDVYYPDKDEWCVEHSIVPFYKTEHACALLPNNKLLIFGGTDAGCTNSYSYLYDISARTWSVAPKIPQFVGDQKKPFAHALVYQ